MTTPRKYQIASARSEGALRERTEPRAVHAEYDRDRDVILVQLESGSWFGFSPCAVPELRGAAAEDLAAVEVEAWGEALHWESLDADVSVPGIIFDSLDAPAWWARWIASRTTEKKAAAARENGKKGGRPRKMPNAAPASQP
jgi:hypothetical protein